jgi:hypothetical protein
MSSFYTIIVTDFIDWRAPGGSAKGTAIATGRPMDVGHPPSASRAHLRP